MSRNVLPHSLGAIALLICVGLPPAAQAAALTATAVAITPGPDYDTTDPHTPGFIDYPNGFDAGLNVTFSAQPGSIPVTLGQPVQIGYANLWEHYLVNQTTAGERDGQSALLGVNVFFVLGNQGLAFDGTVTTYKGGPNGNTLPSNLTRQTACLPANVATTAALGFTGCVGDGQLDFAISFAQTQSVVVAGQTLDVSLSPLNFYDASNVPLLLTAVAETAPQTVPEPAAFLVLATGLAGVCLARARRR